MDTGVLLVLVMLCSCWCSDARELAGPQLNDKVSEGEAHVQELSDNENLCSFCEEFTSKALKYLTQNKTQKEIISILHKSCSNLHSFKQQSTKRCIALVDNYAPLLFSEVSLISADDLCHEVNLCGEGISMSVDLPKDKCELCHTVVAEALLKLKDPDTELEIIEMLLKACNSIGKNVAKCKKLVFEYAPIILINAEQFLESNDMCATLHACDAEAVVSEVSMHAAS